MKQLAVHEKNMEEAEKYDCRRRGVKFMARSLTQTSFVYTRPANIVILKLSFIAEDIDFSVTTKINGLSSFRNVSNTAIVFVMQLSVDFEFPRYGIIEFMMDGYGFGMLKEKDLEIWKRQRNKLSILAKGIYAYRMFVEMLALHNHQIMLVEFFLLICLITLILVWLLLVCLWPELLVNLWVVLSHNYCSMVIANMWNHNAKFTVVVKFFTYEVDMVQAVPDDIIRWIFFLLWLEVTGKGEGSDIRINREILSMEIVEESLCSSVKNVIVIIAAYSSDSKCQVTKDASVIVGPNVIGIDLGMSCSLVEVWQHARVWVIVNDQGNNTTPSSTAFSSIEQLVKDATKNHGVMNPANMIVLYVKRVMGRQFKNSSVQSEMKLWSFNVISGPMDEPLIVVTYKLEGKQIVASSCEGKQFLLAIIISLLQLLSIK